MLATTGTDQQTSGLSSTPGTSRTRGTTGQFSNDPTVGSTTTGHPIGAMDQSAAGVSTGPDTAGLWAQGRGATGLQGTGHSTTLEQDVSNAGLGLTRETGRTSGLASEAERTAEHTHSGGVSKTSPEHTGEHAAAEEEGGLLGKVKKTLGL
jgi:hypothetical protein